MVKKTSSRKTTSNDQINGYKTRKLLKRSKTKRKPFKMIKASGQKGQGFEKLKTWTTIALPVISLIEHLIKLWHG